MRYVKPIHVVQLDNGGRLTQRCFHMIVYVKQSRNQRDYFIGECKRLRITFSKQDDKGNPIPVESDIAGQSAYEIFIPTDNATMNAMESLCAIGKSSLLTNSQLKLANVNRPILDYHFVSDEKIPYGMGKLSGMQKANRKLVDDNRGKDTMVQHGKTANKPIKPIVPDDKGFRGNSGTTVFNAEIREIGEDGHTQRKLILPLVSKPKASKGKLNVQLREWTKEQTRELLERCKQYELEHVFGYHHYFTQDKESFTFKDGAGI